MIKELYKIWSIMKKYLAKYSLVKQQSPLKILNIVVQITHLEICDFNNLVIVVEWK